MFSRRGILGIAFCAALFFAGLDWTQKNVEVVTLHVSGGYTDHYPQVFIVDDPPGVWVRAERPDRIWLASLRSNPEVVVSRGGHDVAYHAEVWNGDGGHQRIDELFRAKYGAFDRLLARIPEKEQSFAVKRQPFPRGLVADAAKLLAAVLIRLVPSADLATGF